MSDGRADTLGKIALGLCLGGMALAIAVGVLAIAQPRAWTMRDAANTLFASELLAIFLGVLARRSTYGAAAWIIAAVLALGALVASR